MLNIPQNEILYLQFGLQCCWLTAAPMLPGHKLSVAVELHSSEWFGIQRHLWYLCSCSLKSLQLLMGYSSADHYGGTLMHPVFVLVSAGKNFFMSPFVVVMNTTSNNGIMDIYPHPGNLYVVELPSQRFHWCRSPWVLWLHNPTTEHLRPPNPLLAIAVV